ncbi:MAG: UbiA prenyltransferase family protein [Candidatus Coatesbacteria bacterium]|nr:UbiA prenyltransferase family protein [Candidatus Coatesbacteria bacterium]
MSSLAAPVLSLVRPFTLLAPFIGFVSAATMASHSLPPAIAYIGAVAAALLNAASNGLNQIFDVDIDRINKSDRPLPAGRLTLRKAGLIVSVLYLASALIAAAVNWTFFAIVLVTAFFTYAYSAPPFRTKRVWWLANLTIAVPRGVLLVVAGWASVAGINDFEPWFVGLVFGLFIFGAAMTKDFADMVGDRAFGCNTLPIVLGPKGAAWVVAPFLSLPFLFISLGTWLGVLSGQPTVLYLLSLALVIWGGYAGYLLVRQPEELAAERNHPSWKHMYLIMLTAQMGVACSYLF